MTTGRGTDSRAASPSDQLAALRRHYGCSPVDLTGSAHRLYERHLLFDNVADPATTGAREHYEALARSVRDVLSQRWVKTEQTYERLNPKRVYYLSMEFLIGRSLTNNITNMLLGPFVSDAVKERSLNWFGLLEREPDAGLGNGGLGRLAACFLDFSRNEPGVFEPLRDSLLNHDYYMHLADLPSYLEADARLTALYADQDAWARKAVLNVAGSGKFSSDRTIAQYAADIWHAKPCPVV